MRIHRLWPLGLICEREHHSPRYYGRKLGIFIRVDSCEPTRPKVLLVYLWWWTLGVSWRMPL